MKFVYGYKTNQNEVREGVVEASSRDDVYQQLKKQGIRPFRVALVPGFANWARSLGKRTYAICLLAVTTVVFIAIALNLSREINEIDNVQSGPMPRHQIYGDPALMADLERSDFAELFVIAGDRVLARYAQPGVVVRQGESYRDMGLKLAESLRIPDGEAVRFVEGERREFAELKRTVLWMRNELRNYLSNGVGTPERYSQKLAERQVRELQIYMTAKSDLTHEKDMAKWNRINESLRAIGLMTIPLPEDLP